MAVKSVPYLLSYLQDLSSRPTSTSITADISINNGAPSSVKTAPSTVLAPSRSRPSLARQPTSAIKNGAPSSVKTAPSTMVLTARLRPSFHSKGGYAGRYLLVNDSALEGDELVLWLTAGRPPTPPSDLRDVRNCTICGATAEKECEGAPCGQSYTAGKEIGGRPTWHEPNLITQSQLKTAPSSPPHCFTRYNDTAFRRAGSGASTIIWGMHMSDELVDWFDQDGHFAATAAATTALRGGGAVKTIDDVGRRGNEGRNRDGLDGAPLLMEMSAVIDCHKSINASELRVLAGRCAAIAYPRVDHRKNISRKARAREADQSMSHEVCFRLGGYPYGASSSCNTYLGLPYPQCPYFARELPQVQDDRKRKTASADILNVQQVRSSLKPDLLIKHVKFHTQDR
ncbi:hypothetical protein B0H14DRAFT_3167541 [Mycena olivaceomarginata]|nr:hypothetical protein B0H14DRAFT_3167541 [Mycena olivaceomarginata]